MIDLLIHGTFKMGIIFPTDEFYYDTDVKSLLFFHRMILIIPCK
jgi:hypothetical protein